MSYRIAILGTDTQLYILGGYHDALESMKYEVTEFTKLSEIALEEIDMLLVWARGDNFVKEFAKIAKPPKTLWLRHSQLDKYPKGVETLYIIGRLPSDVLNKIEEMRKNK